MTIASRSKKLLRHLLAACCGLSMVVSTAFTQVPTDPALREKIEKATQLISDADALGTYETEELSRNAIEKYKVAAAIYKEIGLRHEEALTYTKLGIALGRLGDVREALNYHKQVLPIQRDLGDKVGEAFTLNNIGGAYLALGEMKEGFECFSRGLAVSRDTGNYVTEAMALLNIASVYLLLGDNQKALDYYHEALPVARRTGARPLEALILNNLGVAHKIAGEYRTAIDYLEQTVTISREISERRGEAMALGNIGASYGGLGETRKALFYFDQARSIQRIIGDRAGEALVLIEVGVVYDKVGENQKAMQHYHQALSALHAAGDLNGEAVTFYHLMESAAKDDKNLAVLFGKRSINDFQQVRMNIEGLGLNLQRSFLKTVEAAYRELADLLISRGRVAEAEQVVGMLKEEEYFSFMRRDISLIADLKSRISLSPDEQKAFDEYDRIAQDVTRTAAAFAVLEKKSKSLPLGTTLSPGDQKEYDRLKAEVDAAITVFNKFLDDLKSQFTAQGDKAKQVAVVESDSIGLLKELNEPRTVMISTIAGDDRLNLIVTTSEIHKAHTVTIKAADLNKLVLEFRSALRDPRIDPRPVGKRLYDTLFPAELKKDLDNINADTIVWSLDGTLRYVPMGALWDGKQYLVENYRNAVITLASRNKLSSPVARPTAWTAFGVGVSKKFETFDALPAVPKELCSVVSDPKKKQYCRQVNAGAGVIGGLMLTDGEFTLAAFQSNLGKTPVVHIASHFSLNPGNESDSYLLLGGGEQRRFSLDSLRKTRLDNVELLTLSACNTAMTSGQNASGVEIEGFGALAQKQGARSVMATLWAVADESTSLFMAEFYRIKKANPTMNKAEAIRLAQKEMIDGKLKASGKSNGCRAEEFGSGGTKPDEFRCDPNAPYSHPYFWSPFVLIGNWR